MKIGRDKRGNFGVCQICRKVGKLTFEHFPPKAAFNDRRYKLLLDEEVDLSKYDPRIEEKGYVKQGGIGGYTLCEKCNNHTGTNYVPHYVEWIHKSMENFLRAGQNPSLILPNFIFPLKVFKQIMAIFCSLYADLTIQHPGITPYILDTTNRNFPKNLRVFTYYQAPGNMYRYIPIAIIREPRRRLLEVSEISYPPLGYVLSLNGEVPNGELYEITYFSKYASNHWVDLFHRIPVRNVVIPQSPLDYRSEDEIAKAIDSATDRVNQRNKKSY